MNLNGNAGDGSFNPWHRDNDHLFGHPSEPKGHRKYEPRTLGPVQIASSQVGEYSLTNSVGSWCDLVLTA